MDFVKGEIIAIDKPRGMTSFGALARVRGAISRHLGVRKTKIGHAGTLDPLATGVLVLCTGKATKRIEELQGLSKEYVATLQLGATTPSYDCEHAVDATFPTAHITLEAIAAVVDGFVGDIMQVPPAFSACKVGGTRAYDLSRKGRDVELAPKAIHIESIEILLFDSATMQLSLRVVCGKGTYIRALARDIGHALGSGAYLLSLRRTRVGDITEDRCLRLEDVPQWLKDNDNTTKQNKEDETITV